MTSSDEPDVDFEFLKQVAEIISDMQERQHKLWMSERRRDLRAAERAAAGWEQRRQAQIAKCTDVARCQKARCRRRRNCATVRWLSSRTEASRLRLAAEQAKWPPAEAAPEPPQPSHGHKKKGRTGVRP